MQPVTVNVAVVPEQIAAPPVTAGAAGFELVVITDGVDAGLSPQSFEQIAV